MASIWLKDFTDGSAEERDLLGGKGANLAEMTSLGLPVPPGFTVTTEACRAFVEAGNRLPAELVQLVDDAIVRLEEARGLRFGDPDDPLLLSVRSGAKFSMPGMMDTVLDLGLNPTSVKGLATVLGDAGVAMDSWRRLTEMYARVVLGVPDEALASVRDAALAAAGVADASALDADRTERLVENYRAVVLATTGAPFPDEPRVQLLTAIAAVFESWNGRRARDYRRMEHISDDLGTAVNVQAMVFGNHAADSGTGVVFTRDPATGAPTHYGDWLSGAQGEDVVAGIRTTQPLSSLADELPDAAAELDVALDRLEARYRDMCDVEFTIERGTLWILQTRVGKRSAMAALRIAVDLVDEGLIDEREAVRRFRPEQLERLLHPRFDPAAPRTHLADGLGASPGAASGIVAFTADDAEARAAEGHDVILVRPETSPDDLHGLMAARGILTSRGGLVSHAAVVARGMGRPAVCGADALHIDVAAGRFEVGDVVVVAGDVVSIDGTTGEVALGSVPVVAPERSAQLDRLLGWADDLRRLGVRANADTAEDAARAREMGAEGIGLCRTEHMFLGDRLPVLQDVILAEDEVTRTRALERLHVVQRQDFEDLLEAMDGLPVTVRLLDPPLHEFLPDLTDLYIRRATGELSPDELELLDAAEHWQEHNPMLGIRGVRLAILQPDLYQMQVRALTEAAIARRAAGGDPHVQIMIPLSVSGPELRHALAIVTGAVHDACQLARVQLPVPVGTMIETPRAALRAGELAHDVDFCSFGTNDLTQLTYGFSRDDVEARLVPRYLELGLLDHDPFATIDVDGVGRLVTDAVAAARSADPDVELGVCGEHGGDAESIAFFQDAGLDYVSCSPFRLPVARLAAAHAAIEAELTNPA